jgi:endonuclease/exonuclease/phosphatase (EEP) superfamily protein YafD
MEFKAVQWNIGGGKIRPENAESDPTLIASYNEDGIGHIVSFLKEIGPDIITLQEAHIGQAKIIADQLGYSYCVDDEYSDSHLAENDRLCHAVISRFPIENHRFELFINPHYRAVGEDGTDWISHDKGITTCSIALEASKKLVLQTLHLVPFRRFGVDALGEEAAAVRADIVKKIDRESPVFLLQGDFNYDEESLTEFLPLFNTQTKEVLTTAPTTPKGRRYDHIMYRGLLVKAHAVRPEVLTDHYPIVALFELEA